MPKFSFNMYFLMKKIQKSNLYHLQGYIFCQKIISPRRFWTISYSSHSFLNPTFRPFVPLFPFSPISFPFFPLSPFLPSFPPYFLSFSIFSHNLNFLIPPLVRANDKIYTPDNLYKKKSIFHIWKSLEEEREIYLLP